MDTALIICGAAVALTVFPIYMEVQSEREYAEQLSKKKVEVGDSKYIRLNKKNVNLLCDLLSETYSDIYRNESSLGAVVDGSNILITNKRKITSALNFMYLPQHPTVREFYLCSGKQYQDEAIILLKGRNAMRLAALMRLTQLKIRDHNIPESEIDAELQKIKSEYRL